MTFVAIPIIDNCLFAMPPPALVAAETVCLVMIAAEILLGVGPCLKRGEPGQKTCLPDLFRVTGPTGLFQIAGMNP
jgi:hypothetical protein